MKSWIATSYFSNLSNSFVTSSWFSPLIELRSTFLFLSSPQHFMHNLRFLFMSRAIMPHEWLSIGGCFEVHHPLSSLWLYFVINSCSSKWKHFQQVYYYSDRISIYNIFSLYSWAERSCPINGFQEVDILHFIIHFPLVGDVIHNWVLIQVPSTSSNFVTSLHPCTYHVAYNNNFGFHPWNNWSCPHKCHLNFYLFMVNHNFNHIHLIQEKKPFSPTYYSQISLLVCIISTQWKSHLQ